MEEAPGRIAQLANLLEAEGSGIEILSPCLRGSRMCTDDPL